jgi:hypothetical protein
MESAIPVREDELLKYRVFDSSRRFEEWQETAKHARIISVTPLLSRDGNCFGVFVLYAL